MCITSRGVMAPNANGYDLTTSSLTAEVFGSGGPKHERLGATPKRQQSIHSIEFRTRHSMKAINLSLLLCALLAALTGIAYLLFDPIVKHVVLDQLVLRNNSEFAKLWENPPIHPHFKVYFFNLTNAEKFFAGREAPKVEEVGPYFYYQKWTKEDVAWHGNGTISFRTRKDFRFVPEMSVGDHSTDRIIALNVPALSAMYQMRLASAFSRYGLEAVLALLGYRMWVDRTPEELIWGYDEPLFDLAKLTLPNPPELDRFGFFTKKNDTTDLPLYTMYTGEGNPYNLSQISLFKGESSLKLWGREPSTDLNKCNVVRGSDGATFNPYIQRDDTLWFFNDQLCHAMPLVYEKDVKSGELPGYRFVPRSDVFASPESEPANSCFCEDEGLCDHIGDAMFAVSKCQMDAPIVLSWPHFLHADPKFVGSVEGLRPDKKLHGFHFDIQQTTGTTIAAKARIQVNLAVLKSAAFTSLTELNDTIVPVLWFDEGLDGLGPDLGAVVGKAVLTPPLYKSYLLCVLAGLCTSIAVIGFVACVRSAMNLRVAAAEEEEVAEASGRRRDAEAEGENLQAAVRNILHDNFPHPTTIIKRFENEEHCARLLESSADSSRVSSTSHSRNSSTGSSDPALVHKPSYASYIPEVPSTQALLLDPALTQ